MNATTRTPFIIDAALADVELPRFSMATRTWNVMEGMWLKQIESEVLKDFGFDVSTPAIPPKDLMLDPSDGALVRMSNKQHAGLAYTRHGWGQLVTLLQYHNEDRPSGAANVLFWLWPLARHHAFENVVTRSKRKPSDLLVFRTFLRTGKVGSEVYSVRALRSVVSRRHSGEYLDDKPLIGLLSQHIDPASKAWVVRTVNVTHGYADLYGGDDVQVQGSLHWRNSETGAARLGFSGGVTIRFIEAVARAKLVEQVSDADAERLERSHVLAATGRRLAINHTLPRKNTTDEQRRDIATSRMTALLLKAREDADKLVGAWRDAKLDVPEAFVGGASQAYDILLDAVEERHGMDVDVKAAAQKLLEDEHRLKKVPHGSAAQIACIYALLAKEASSIDKSIVLQEEAGWWLLNGWSK